MSKRTAEKTRTSGRLKKMRQDTEEEQVLEKGREDSPLTDFSVDSGGALIDTEEGVKESTTKDKGKEPALTKEVQTGKGVENAGKGTRNLSARGQEPTTPVGGSSEQSCSRVSTPMSFSELQRMSMTTPTRGTSTAAMGSESPGVEESEEEDLESERRHPTELPEECAVMNVELQDRNLLDTYEGLPCLDPGTFLSWNQTGDAPVPVRFEDWGKILTDVPYFLNMKDIFKFVRDRDYINPTRINPMLLSTVPITKIRDRFNLQVRVRDKWANAICITPIRVTTSSVLTITGGNEKAATICMAFKVDEIEVPGCNGSEMTFGTATRKIVWRAIPSTSTPRSKTTPTKAPPPRPKAMGKAVGKPPKKSTRKYMSLRPTDPVPVFDARQRQIEFTADYFDSLNEQLERFPGEIPEDSYVLVGYTVNFFCRRPEPGQPARAFLEMQIREAKIENKDEVRDVQNLSKDVVKSADIALGKDKDSELHRLLKKGDDEEEWVARVIGVVVAKDLPPYQRWQHRKEKTAKDLKQQLTITGLGSEVFNEYTEAAHEVTKRFNPALRTREPPAYKEKKAEGSLAFQATTPVFTLRAHASSPEDIPFTQLEDPDGSLSAVRGSDFIHTQDNYVEYRKLTKGVGEPRYERSGPNEIKVGDVVELEVYFRWLKLQAFTSFFVCLGAVTRVETKFRREMEDKQAQRHKIPTYTTLKRRRLFELPGQEPDRKTPAQGKTDASQASHARMKHSKGLQDLATREAERSKEEIERQQNLAEDIQKLGAFRIDSRPQTRASLPVRENTCGSTSTTGATASEGLDSQQKEQDSTIDSRQRKIRSEMDMQVDETER
ncbi:hypothetical protein NP233_g4407 [Leucocoprinus birnbaumii]|uniref:Uncharacterized protein n=1 Tax=Leucocoprinus birnbaumii TaxID=56174 RepID=A0AAD5W168_9AGAR|nr:hypothetical protein NP233_g4407 [Leucocoprinus birnbaumii]